MYRVHIIPIRAEEKCLSSPGQKINTRFHSSSLPKSSFRGEDYVALGKTFRLWHWEESIGNGQNTLTAKGTRANLMAFWRRFACDRLDNSLKNNASCTEAPLCICRRQLQKSFRTYFATYGDLRSCLRSSEHDCPTKTYSKVTLGWECAFP